MGMIRKIKSCLNYYRSLMPLNLFVSLFCAFLVVKTQHTEILPVIVLVKAAVISVSVWWGGMLRPHELYYYRNLGIPRLLVWGVAVFVDFLLFFLIIFLTYFILL